MVNLAFIFITWEFVWLRNDTYIRAKLPSPHLPSAPDNTKTRDDAIAILTVESPDGLLRIVTHCGGLLDDFPDVLRDPLVALAQGAECRHVERPGGLTTISISADKFDRVDVRRLIGLFLDAPSSDFVHHTPIPSYCQSLRGWSVRRWCKSPADR